MAGFRTVMGSGGRRPVAVVCHLLLPFADVVSVLRAETTAVVADQVSAEGTLIVTLRPSPMAMVRWDVEVHLGPPIEDDETVGWPLWWEAARHPALFPTLDAGLEVAPHPQGTELRLVGSYAVPLGVVGSYGDSLRGHRVAHACLEDFLGRISARITIRALDTDPSPEG